MNRPRLALVGWLGLGIAAAVVSIGVASTLPLPPRSLGPGLTQWYQQVGPGPALAVLLWFIALGMVARAVVGTGLLLFASWRPASGLDALARRVSPPILRGLAGGVAGLSIGVVAGPDLDPDRTPGTAVLRPLGDDEVVSEAAPAPPAPPEPASPKGDPATPSEPAPAPSATPVEAPGAPHASAADAGGERYVVRPGDHFWAIAEDVVADELGRVPTEREVARYWRTLVAANRSRLVDPGNTDLLYAHQELVLPPL